MALCIDRAEHVLKPFVDAILAKYGVKPGQLQTSGEVKADASVPVRKVRRGGNEIKRFLKMMTGCAQIAGITTPSWCKIAAD